MVIQDLFFSAILFSNMATILSSTELEDRRLRYLRISKQVAMMTRSVKNAVTIVESVVFKIGKINGMGITNSYV